MQSKTKAAKVEPFGEGSIRIVEIVGVGRYMGPMYLTVDKSERVMVIGDAVMLRQDPKRPQDVVLFPYLSQQGNRDMVVRNPTNYIVDTPTPDLVRARERVLSQAKSGIAIARTMPQKPLGPRGRN